MLLPSIPSVADAEGGVRGTGEPPVPPEFNPLESDTSLAADTALYSAGIEA